MLTIPTDLASWAPGDVTHWLTDVHDDPEVSDQEYAAAQAAANEAIIGT